MSEGGKRYPKNVSDDGHTKRVGTSVLIAAISVLGSSLGFSIATSAEPVASGAQESTDQKAAKLSEKKTLLAKDLSPKINVPTPHVSVKPQQQKINTNAPNKNMSPNKNTSPNKHFYTQ